MAFRTIRRFPKASRFSLMRLRISIKDLGIFFSRRMLVIFFLGLASGLPLALSGSSLSIWLKDSGGSLETISLFTLVGLPYTLKFLWAPLIDTWQVPFFSRLLGHRRGWIIFSQIFLALAVLFLASLNPIEAPFMVALGAMMVATASATQDIVIDAFRLEYLKKEEQAPGIAYFITAYRFGMLIGGGGLILFVAWLKTKGVSLNDAWFYGYASMACLILIGIVGTLLVREFTASQTTEQNLSKAEVGLPFRKLIRNIHLSFNTFLKKPQSFYILALIVSYKLCDAIAGNMIAPFILDIGFSMESYASIVKGIGFIATLCGSFLGGIIAARTSSLAKSLLIGGILQAVSNLGFAWQALVGADHLSLSGVIIAENLCASAGTVIFVTYIAALCNTPLHIATHFALLTALSTVGRTLISSFSSGFIAAKTGWVLFFIITSFTVIPSFLLLAWLKRCNHFENLLSSDNEPYSEGRPCSHSCD